MVDRALIVRGDAAATVWFTDHEYRPDAGWTIPPYLLPIFGRSASQLGLAVQRSDQLRQRHARIRDCSCGRTCGVRILVTNW